VGGDSGRFIDAGAFIPLENLITPEIAPNLRNHFDPFWRQMTMPDGHIYIAQIYETPVGHQYQMENWNSGFWIQKAVLDYVGFVPTTLDEYFAAIEEYMLTHPEIEGIPTRGFEILCDGWRAFCIKNPPLFLNGQPNWGDVDVNEATNTAFDRYSAPDYAKEYYRKLNEENHKGVISDDTVTLTYDQYIARIASGVVLGMFDQMWNFNDGQNVLRAEGRDDRTYLPVPVTFPGKAPTGYMDAMQFSGSNGLGVTTKCKDPTRFVQYMDYLIREEVQRFMKWGVEGEHWFFNSMGRMERPEEQRVLQRDTRWSIDNLGFMLHDFMPKIQGSYSDGNAADPTQQPEEYFAALTEYDKELFSKLGILNQAGLLPDPQERPVYYPVWSMTLEDGSPAQIAAQRVDDANLKFLPQLVLVDEDGFDALWDEYQAALAACNPDVWIEEVNRQIQVRIETWN